MDKSHPMATHERTIRGRHFSNQLMTGVLRVFSWSHITLYRWTGGFIGGHVFGNRMLLLTTTGRKTGQPRTTPVAYLADGDALVIVGGAAGVARLVAQPPVPSRSADPAREAQAAGERLQSAAGGAASLGALSCSARSV